MTKQNLIATAKELNELLGLEPAISIKVSEEAMAEKIKEASELLEPEDKLSKVATATLKEINEGGKKIASNKKVATPVEDEDEDEDDDAPEADEDDDDEDEDVPPAKPVKKSAPVKEEDEDDEEEDEKPAPKKKVDAPKKEKAAAFKSSKETIGTSRMIEVAKAMQAIKGTQTVDAIAEKADAAYVKAGGSVNIKQDKNIIKVLLPAAVQWGIVVEKDGKLSNP